MKTYHAALSLLLAGVLALSLTACGGGSEPPSSGGTGAPPAGTAPADPAAPTPDAPGASGGAAESALDILLSKEDKLPLGGLQAAHLESRADIDKGLPMSKTNDDDITIGWASVSLASTYFTELYDSAQAKCDEYGYTLHYQNCNFDLNTQMTQIDTFLTQGVDFLVVNAVDIDATLVYYQQAVSQGIPVILLGPTTANAEYPIVTAILSSSFEAGYAVGEYVAEKLYDELNGAPMEVGFVISRAGDGLSNSRPCGFISGYLVKKAELDGNPYPSRWDGVLDGYNIWIELRDQGSAQIDGTMDLVGYVAAGGTDTSSGQQVAADLITGHPTMDMVFVETDSLSPGVLQELELHNLTPGEDVYVCCAADGAKYVLEYIMEGKMLATGTNVPYYAGGGIIDIIHDILDGYDANNLPANVFTPTGCINVDNVEDYYDPNEEFPPQAPWTLQNIDEYNAANAGA